MDIFKELTEIGQLLNSTSRLDAVRKAVAKAKEDGVIVTDGRHHQGAEGYDVVVRCDKDVSKIARRIRDDIPDVNVKRIANNVLGVSTARRGGR
jgi:hypothetical protein